MSAYRYKAYLSYSHVDQRWAEWLHRALERYRVPRRLADSPGRTLPKNLAPVFRDREDLSSAADLSERLQEALEQSEAMVVLCSPAAAGSRWVNEEIRAFKALGRGDRIHCMVVDGDPQAPPGEGGCFPPALFEGVAEGAAEPLAADPRKFADGKRLAMLKIAAGLLGVRLDTLRRRDLARRRRLQVLTTIAAVAGLTLAGLTFTSRLAEREARLAEQQERAQAEQMAAFIVDLGEELGSSLDLESLGRMSATAMSYLDQIDPARLTMETRIKVGKALRQVGDVNWNQGKIEAAEEAFERSRAIFVELSEAYPGDDEILFQLSQAEFYSGYVHLDTGENDQTRVHWNRYLEIARDRHQEMPEDPRWLLELSYATSNLVNIGIQLGEPVDGRVLDAIRENIELAGRAMAASAGDPDVLSHYVNELAFAADALVSVCRLEEAKSHRIASLSVTEQLAGRSGASVYQLLQVAYRHAGMAGVLAELGENGLALEHLDLAAAEFERQFNRDPSNEALALDLGSAHRRLGKLHMYAGRLDVGSEHLDRARQILEPLSRDPQVTVEQLDEFRRLVLEEVAWARLSGDQQQALDLLDLHRDLLASPEFGEEASMAIRSARVEYRYERWRLTGTDPADSSSYLLTGLPEDQGEYTGCYEADLLARHAAMVGNDRLLQRQAAYLGTAGYRSAGYLEFCQSAGICGS